MSDRRSVPSLTADEWFALAGAVAERAENLRVRAEDGERTGRELAALSRAERKVRDVLCAERSWAR